MPYSVTSGDFNNDSKTDLVTANNGGYVSILLGNGDGTFGTAVIYAVEGSPRSVTTGDFNNDSKTDLATANHSNHNVSILLGVGDGTFAAAVNYGAGHWPYSVTTGDFNADGKTDLVTANSGDSNVSILLGVGDGTFGTAVNYAVGGNPNSVATGDFNNDSKTDLATANYSNVSILLGVGDGTFAAAVNYGAGYYDVTTGDFNKDGKTDLVTADQGGGDVSILLGVGDGTFATVVNYGTADGPSSVTAGDFNADGKTDLATANYDWGSGNVSILINSTPDPKAITAFTIPGQTGSTTIDEGAHTIALTMPYLTDVTALTPTITITGASVSPASGVTHDFTNPSTYTVTAADAATQDYVVTVTRGKNYFWTWYDNIGGDNWVLMANPDSAAQNLTFNLSIGGNTMNLSNYNTGVVAPGDSITPIFNGIMDGPVKAKSLTGGKGIVSQRILWPKDGNSLEEVPGTDSEKLSNHFFWTWYDDLSTGYTNYVMVANPGTTNVFYRIKIAGDNQSAGSSGEIAPGQSAFWRDGAKRGGPVEVEAWGDAVDGSVPANVMASQRVLSNGNSAFNEVPGIPETELSDRYVWTWYDNHSAGAQDWIMIANHNPTPLYYEISIGGWIVWGDAYGGLIPAGGYITPTLNPPYVSAATGPVEVRTYSDVAHTTPMNSIASQRVIWGPSFEEVPGYPYSALTNTYHWTWYDQSAAGVYNWVMVSKQDFASDTVWYKVLVAGEVKKSCTQIPVAGRDTPAFPGIIGGPVEVRSYSDSGCTVPSASGNGVMASQRVLWKGYFNEVVGTVLE